MHLLPVLLPWLACAYSVKPDFHSDRIAKVDMVCDGMVWDTTEEVVYVRSEGKLHTVAVENDVFIARSTVKVSGGVSGGHAFGLALGPGRLYTCDYQEIKIWQRGGSTLELLSSKQLARPAGSGATAPVLRYNEGKSELYVLTASHVARYVVSGEELVASGSVEADGAAFLDISVTIDGVVHIVSEGGVSVYQWPTLATRRELSYAVKSLGSDGTALYGVVKEGVIVLDMDARLLSAFMISPLGSVRGVAADAEQKWGYVWSTRGVYMVDTRDPRELAWVTSETIPRIDLEKEGGAIAVRWWRNETRVLIAGNAGLYLYSYELGVESNVVGDIIMGCILGLLGLVCVAGALIMLHQRYKECTKKPNLGHPPQYGMSVAPQLGIGNAAVQKGDIV